MSTMKASVLFLSIFIGSSLHAQAGAQAISYKIVTSADLTGSGRIDTATFEIHSQSWEVPIDWTLKIVSNGRVVYFEKGNDAWFDKSFPDITAKKNYYLRKSWVRVEPHRQFKPNEVLFSKAYTGSIYNTAGKELVDKYHFSESKSSEIINRMIKKLVEGKGIVITWPDSPIESSFPRMYCEDVGTFLVIYVW